MTQLPLDDLVPLLKARQRNAEARLHSIRQEEQALRDQIAHLDATDRKSQDLPIEDILKMRGVGGDLAWRDWMQDKRRSLQIELAQVLARKGLALKELRRAFGRSSAIEALCDKNKDEQGRERARKVNAALSQAGLMKLADRGGPDTEI